jgi:hypothetical protein
LSRRVGDVTVEGGLLNRLVSDLKGKLRFRKRGRLTNTLGNLGSVLGGNTRGWTAPRDRDMPDWWLPDLTGRSDARRAVSWLRVWCPHGIRITGTGVTSPVAGRDSRPIPSPVKELGEEEAPMSFFHWVELAVGTEGRVLRVCPELLARLSTYAALRPRNLELLMVLRSRALEWVKTVQLPYQDAALVLPGTIALACCLSRQEMAAVDLLGSRAVEKSVLASSSLAAGEPHLDLGVVDSTRRWLGRVVPSMGRAPFAQPWFRQVLFPRGA